MAGMLKPKDRERSKKSLERFLSSILDESNFTVDILVHSKQGNCIYYCVPCSVITEFEFPNLETSYSLNIWWSKAEKRVGNPPKDGFPNYPACSEYKTYFNSMWFQSTNLSFENVWRDAVWIYVFIHDDGIDNTGEIEKLANMIKR